MKQLVEEAKNAINFIREQDKPRVEVMEALEEVFEHLDVAIDVMWNDEFEGRIRGSETR